MKKLILPLVVLAAQTAQAAPTQKLTCSFTEPFFTLEIDLKGKTVTQTEPDWESDPIETKTTVIATEIRVNATLKDPFFPTYQIVGKDGSVIAKLAMNMKGNNGMSDYVNPFEIQYATFWGGCDSDKIKGVDPREF